MALTRQQFDELRAKGLTVDQIIKFESGQVPVTTQAKPNFFQGVGQKLQARGKKFASEIGKAGKGELASTSLGTIARATTRAGSLVGGSLGDIIVEGVKAVLPQKTEEKIKSGISNIASQPIPQKVIQSVSSWAEKNPEAAKDLEGALEITGLIPLTKGIQVGGKAVIQTGKEVAGDISKVAGKTLATTGAVTEKAGKSLVSASFPPTKSQAKAILNYKAKTPLLKRVELAAKSAEKAPITPSEVALKYNLIGVSRSEIGAKAKRVANQLFENQVNPVISGIEKKVNVKDLFNSVKKTIDKTADTSKRKSLINAFNSLKDDYKNVSTLSYKKLDQIKSEMSKGLPAKVWQGKDIAGEFNNVRKMFSDKAREVIRKELPDNVKRVYDEYGSLLSIMEKGEKSLQRGLDIGILGLTSEAIRRGATPLTTIGGKAINKAGEVIKGVGQRLQKGGTKLKSQGEKGSLLNIKPGLTIEDVSKVSPKGKGEILKTTQKLDSLNPTGSVFAKYSPKQRATAELADNITTLDKTMGKSADEMITVYRGSSKGGEIVPGDFITTNKQLAKDYAGTGKVLEKKVKLSDVLDDITEPLGEEYIYRPKTNLKSTPLVSKNDDLIQEAKKYKSADEFIKSQPILYHGTYGKFETFKPYNKVPMEFRDSSGQHTFGTYFTDNKKLAGQFGDNIMERNVVVKKPIDLSNIKSFEELVDKLGLDTPKNDNILGNMQVNSHFYKFGGENESPYRALEALNDKFKIVNKLKKQGYDAMIFSDIENGIKGKTIVVFDVNNIKTKSQLTDIWNKSHKLKSKN